MINKELREQIEDDIVILDNLDECIIGVDNRTGVLIYDRELIVKSLLKDMNYDEAEEYVEYNVYCLYAGDTTPIILRRLESDY